MNRVNFEVDDSMKWIAAIVILAVIVVALTYSLFLSGWLNPSKQVSQTLINKTTTNSNSINNQQQTAKELLLNLINKSNSLNSYRIVYSINIPIFYRSPNLPKSLFSGNLTASFPYVLSVNDTTSQLRLGDQGFFGNRTIDLTSDPNTQHTRPISTFYEINGSTFTCYAPLLNGSNPNDTLYQGHCYFPTDLTLKLNDFDPSGYNITYLQSYGNGSFSNTSSDCFQIQLNTSEVEDIMKLQNTMTELYSLRALDLDGSTGFLPDSFTQKDINQTWTLNMCLDAQYGYPTTSEIYYNSSLIEEEHVLNFTLNPDNNAFSLPWSSKNIS